MFYRSIPKVITQFLYKELTRIEPKKALIPFSGNFSVEQILKIADSSIEIHSADTNLYSRAIGCGLIGKNIDASLKEEIITIAPFLGTLKTPLEIAAQVIYLQELGELVSDGKLRAHEPIIKNILAKLEKMSHVIGYINFYENNSTNLLINAEAEDFIFYDSPVIPAELDKVLNHLESCYNFNPLQPVELTPEIKKDQVENLAYKDCRVYYRTYNPITPPDGFKEVFRYQYQKDKFHCIYTNTPGKLWVGRAKDLEQKDKVYPMLSEADVITDKSKVEIAPIPLAVAQHYILLWSKKEKEVSNGYAFLIAIDKKLLGIVVIETATKGAQLATLAFDLVVPFTNYTRLDSLILHIISSRQFIGEFNNTSMWEHIGITTKVFCTGPISTKHRGIFELVDRETDADLPADEEHILIYHKTKDFYKTVNEGLRAWIKKYSRYQVKKK